MYNEALKVISARIANVPEYVVASCASKLASLLDI